MRCQSLRLRSQKCIIRLRSQKCIIQLRSMELIRPMDHMFHLRLMDHMFQPLKRLMDLRRRSRQLRHMMRHRSRCRRPLLDKYQKKWWR
mmetsp:Transcript_90610/g.277445  ORF Transcript_90610/g.277445 Transcript_90610/m.277445 type:complete len:89 (+) Transcript_90610:751-1017(+)